MEKKDDAKKKLRNIFFKLPNLLIYKYIKINSSVSVMKSQLKIQIKPSD